MRALVPPPRRLSPPGAGTLLVAGLLIGVLAVVVWPTTSLVDEQLMSVRFGAWIQGVVLFALGVMAGEATTGTRSASADLGVGSGAQRRWGWVTLVGSAAVVALVGSISATGELEDALHRMTWQAVAFALVYGLVSVSFSVWCPSWFQRRWAGRRPWLQRAGRASYATYLLHPLVLTGVMVSLWWVPGGPGAKFLLVVALGVPACFVAGYAVTRLPAVRRLL